MCYAIAPKTGGKIAATFDYLEGAITFALPSECVVEGDYFPDDYIDSERDTTKWKSISC
jgi:hypothetical protein